MQKTPRILYIDDEEDLVMLAQSFFEDENLPIDISTDFDHALEQIRTKEYDIVITDSNLPVGSGEELIKTVKSDGSYKGKFVLVTGNIDCGDVMANLGFDLIIYKPLHFEDLIKQVKKLVTGD